MKMKYAMPKRIVSFLLMLSLLVGALPMLTTPAQAIYHPENAPAASLDLLAQTGKNFTALPSGGMFRVINGELYVWGSNDSNSLGLGTDYKYNGKTVDTTTAITEPIKHPYDFKGNIIQIDCDNSGAVHALTDEGYVYSWGGSLLGRYILNYIDGKPSSSTPYEWDISAVTEAGHTLVGLDAHSPTYISVYDEEGNCYIGGSRQYASPMIGTTPGKILPILDSFVDQFQKSYDSTYTLSDTEQAAVTAGTHTKSYYQVRNENERAGGSQRTTITRLYPMHNCAAAFIWMSDDRFFAYNGNDCGQNWQPDKLDASGNVVSYGDGITEVLKEEQNRNLIVANPQLDTIVSTGGFTGVVDASGNGWLSGGGPGGSVATTAAINNCQTPFYPKGTNFRRPQKVYDANLIGAKCLKVFVSSSLAVFLTEDNSLYAVGKNTKQMITTLEADGAYITTPTQIFADLSTEQTITGVYVTNSGVMVVTKSGEQYYAGDNSKGSAGTGTTESSAPGTIIPANPSTVPPIEPYTANEIIFEIEDGNGNTYRTTGDLDNSRNPLIQQYDKEGGLVGKPTSAMELKAGKDFKLNVYFKDFGKLTSWVVPIRFDNSRVKVVNGDGQIYSDTSEVTPGSIGPSVGITKCFTTQQWSQGVLAGEGGTNGTYPKICNGDSWLSVMGYTTDKSASIDGEVKMFSVNFTVVNSGTTPIKIFDFARDDNIINNPTVGIGYDAAGWKENHCGPYWKVTMDDAESQARFAFKYDERTFSPKIKTTVEPLRNMSLMMERSDGTELNKEDSQTVGSGSNTMTVTGGYAINMANTSEIYKISVVTNDGTNSASFPQSDWTVSLSFPNNGVIELTDYITIVERRDTYIRIKLPDDFSQESEGVIRVEAKSQRYSTISAYAEIVIKTYDAPTKILIDQKASLTDETKIYDTVDPTALDATFTVSYPESPDGFANLAVTWKLLDKNGNELDATNLRNAASLQKPTQPVGNWRKDGAGFTPASVAVSPAHTTFGEDYLILHVESLYDPSVCDEVKIKVHLKATELKFRQDMVRMPTDSTKDLNTLLSIGPENDYYEVDLEWSWEPLDPVENYIIFNGTGVISSGSTATPTGVSDSYEHITVTDRISGKSAEIDIAVISLNSPIKPDDVKVYNLLGPDSDYITVNGLQVGDYITFYQDYGTPHTDENLQNGLIKEFGPLTTAQVASGTYNFPVRNFLLGQGGEIGMQLKRKADASDETETEYDRIPVGYDCEPSKVYGYVKLAGKVDGSARNAGIQIQLTGLSSPDIVTTDSKGYFEFTTYIIPGTYTMSIYQDNYLKRVIKSDVATGYQGLVIPSGVEEFAISTEDDPIVLYPGDLNADGAINATDVNQYVRSWVGRTNTVAANFANYDFFDGSGQVIDLDDLDMVIRRNGWVRENYPKWTTPAVS